MSKDPPLGPERKAKQEQACGMRTHRHDVVCGEAAGVLDLRAEVAALSQRLECAAGGIVEGAHLSTQDLQHTRKRAGEGVTVAVSCLHRHALACGFGRSGWETCPGLALVTSVRVSALTLKLTMLLRMPVTGSCRARPPPVPVSCGTTCTVHRLLRLACDEPLHAEMPQP